MCGVISFARFMEQALYCPELGYYERQSNTPGRAGDFYTSVSVGSLFGELLAFRFARWLDQRARPGLQILESGAHNGQLAADILNWLEARRPDVFARMEYCILEPSQVRRKWQQKSLGELARKVCWFESWERLPPSGVDGIIFSNELLDAMPVHRLGWDAEAGEWFEWGVGVENGQFVWKRMSPKSETRTPHSALSVCCAAFTGPQWEKLMAVLPDGFTTEISPAAVAWWRQAASSLKQGRLLTFDYGLDAEQFLAPERAGGTLRAYRRQRLSDDLLANAGDQDLTAHVNFTALQQAGESAGLKTEGLYSQAEFLTRVAEATWNAKPVFGDWMPARVRQFQTLTHPEHLGRSFKVLLQSR